MYICIGILILIALFFCIFFHWRKKCIIKKVCQMPPDCRHELLNSLVEPFGYQYEPKQEIFSNTKDAWQKEFGYGAVYDRLAPYMSMVIDCLPVYFDYNGKTWLIEFWKGQYGINAGCEAGVYHADSIVPKSLRPVTIFQAAEDEELPLITEKLFDHSHLIAKQQKAWWWQTIFSMGRFCKPKNLCCHFSISFPTNEMLNAFVKGLIEAGFPEKDFHICCMEVHFIMKCSFVKMCIIKRLYCRYVLWKNHLFCRLYHLLTRPFPGTCEKLLYLYYYLPFCFRRMFRLKRIKKSKKQCDKCHCHKRKHDKKK